LLVTLALQAPLGAAAPVGELEGVEVPVADISVGVPDADGVSLAIWEAVAEGELATIETMRT
jgi:hypothetical protein